MYSMQFKEKFAKTFPTEEFMIALVEAGETMEVGRFLEKNLNCTLRKLTQMIYDKRDNSNLQKKAKILETRYELYEEWNDYVHPKYHVTS